MRPLAVLFVECQRDQLTGARATMLNETEAAASTVEIGPQRKRERDEVINNRDSGTSLRERRGQREGDKHESEESLGKHGENPAGT